LVYWTGDLPAHNLWNQTRDDQLAVLKVIVGLFKKYLPKKQIFPALGNHESAPANNFAPHFPDLPEKYSIDWLYFALADEWADWIKDPTNIATVRRIGSYMAKVRPGLRLISLNVNYCYNSN
jgi:sphingomyelin phosphodiesterase